MSLIGEPWAPSPPHVFVDKAGNEVTLVIHERGYTITDAGGTTQGVHCEETDDPDVILMAGRKFRAIPG